MWRKFCIRTRRPDSGLSAHHPGFVCPPRLRSVAFICSIYWIKWERLASVASKKDFLSPAVVALPADRGLETGLWFMVPKAFLSHCLEDVVFHRVNCNIMFVPAEILCVYTFKTVIFMFPDAVYRSIII